MKNKRKAIRELHLSIVGVDSRLRALWGVLKEEYPFGFTAKDGMRRMAFAPMMQGNKFLLSIVLIFNLLVLRITVILWLV